MSTIRSRIDEVCARIRTAALSCGRDPEAIQLIAVSKTYPVEAIHEAAACGLTAFGENRVQELVPKMETGPENAEWHMIGTLQTNKIKYLVHRVDWIDSVPSIKALEEIEKRAAAAGRVINVLIQVNISDEDQKSGCDPGDLPALLAAAEPLPHVAVRGLMGIASLEADMDVVRPQFRTLRELRDAHLGADAHLSMGMSHDMEVAIEEGATMVRIGSSIFGQRTVF